MASQMENLIYHRVDVEDVSHEPIHLYFEGAVEFISNHLEQEQRVLVHCRSGVSRSATIVLAYMVSARRYTLHDAFFLVRFFSQFQVNKFRNYFQSSDALFSYDAN